MTPQEFVAKWRSPSLTERQSYQSHFSDVCRLVGVEPPGSSETNVLGLRFGYEVHGPAGYADVYLENHFAIEYKRPGEHPSLQAAYEQLKRYQEQLNHPPLLIVTDIDHWEIHTAFQSTRSVVHRFSHEDIASRPDVLELLKAAFRQPELLNPTLIAERITGEAAADFQQIVDNMRQWDSDPGGVARFLTKIVFCLFAEDIGLLPVSLDNRNGLFRAIIKNSYTREEDFAADLSDLFRVMDKGGRLHLRHVRPFNGSLFADADVIPLKTEALETLLGTARHRWNEIEPTIFGTLFERALDKRKRAQLGAHYTSRQDIELVITPVLIAPLRREWQQVKAQAAALAAQTGETARRQRESLRRDLLARLHATTVLDPACGSGNFLYVALQSLLTLEHEILHDCVWAGLPPAAPAVHPIQMYGIEIDPIAHALARIVVWIGYLQWRHVHGDHITETPVLDTESADNIRCMDAILSLPPASQDGGGSGVGSEPDWRSLRRDGQGFTVIVGNPPFLGGSKLRGELGDAYYEALTRLYEGRVPGFSDLVCYWFEKARAMVEAGQVQRVGLLATNSIRGGANREVLKRIKQTGNIFMAYADRDWRLDGAAVRVSIVGFDKGAETDKTLDGLPVSNINPDLTAVVDITVARRLSEMKNICFRTDEKGGPFDITGQIARQMIDSDPKNSAVVRPYINSLDIVRANRGMWIIDFGVNVSDEYASQFSLPYAYVKETVKPVREAGKSKREKQLWWLHRRPAPDMRKVVEPLERYIATPSLAKHRIFVWLDSKTLPDHQLIAFARDDDYFFGVLHSKIHEIWSLRMGTSLEDRPRYTPTTTFETFPFPYVPGQEPLEDPCYLAIAAAARTLHEERAAWLNGAAITFAPQHPLRRTARSKTRTLTNLYNALAAYRKTGVPDDDAFIERLAVLHDALDAAVCATYGWPSETLADDEAILARLLALNTARAQTQPS